MLDLKFVCDEPQAVKKMLLARGDSKTDLTKITSLNRARKELILKVEKLKELQNKVSKEVAQLKGQRKEASQKILEMKEVSNQVKGLDQQLSEIEVHLKQEILLLPNIFHATVPLGKDENDNKEIRKWGKLPSFSFTPKDHLELGEKLDIIDMKRAAKITGARFSIYKGLGAKLERSLINFMLNANTAKGYTEIFPPLMVNSKSMLGTGQLPKFANEAFKVENTDYYLIPTSEVPLTNIYSDEILSKEELPLYFTAYTPCFRSEAGSHGKDVRGLIRQHQFNKVEIVKIVEPERSFDELEKLTADAENILQQLGLAYRVVSLCAGELGFGAAKTYDLEVWIPSQNRYREISSCSNFTDFQSRRMNLRYKPAANSKSVFPHTLNGSSLAVGRTFLAILENFQQKDGSIEIPRALVPYVGTEVIKKQ